jgi:hypothetical protein
MFSVEPLDLKHEVLPRDLGEMAIQFPGGRDWVESKLDLRVQWQRGRQIRFVGSLPFDLWASNWRRSFHGVGQ